MTLARTDHKAAEVGNKRNYELTQSRKRWDALEATADYESNSLLFFILNMT
jgi:hypothetical protein